MLKNVRLRRRLITPMHLAGAGIVAGVVATIATTLYVHAAQPSGTPDAHSEPPATVTPAPRNSLLPDTSATPRQTADQKNGSSAKVLPRQSSLAILSAVFNETAAWEQNFSKQPNGPIDTSVWHFETGAGGWGNNEAQHYTDRPQNARIEDGKLVIRAAKEGDTYTSARIVSRKSFTPQYGRLVWRAKMAAGVGTWSALWLWPAGGGRYTQDSVSGGGNEGLVNGELDAVEHVGAMPTEINSSAHAYRHYPGHQVRAGQTIVGDATSTFHDYEMRWQPDSISFLVDGREYHRVDKAGAGVAGWPYDQKYFLVINLAMGGDWGGMLRDTHSPLGINDASQSGWRLEIQSIRYYTLR